MANVIFDFDGTLADTLPLVLEMFYRWTGKTPYTSPEIERFKNMTLREVMVETGIPAWKLPALIVKGRTELSKGMPKAVLFSGIEKVLPELKHNGHSLYLASSNSTGNVNEFLDKNNLAQYFNGIYGNIGIFGKYKVIRSIIKQQKLSADETYYVGDETRDIEAAKKSKVKSISVTWGYNGKLILKAHNPDFIVNTPLDLLPIFSTAV